MARKEGGIQAKGRKTGTCGCRHWGMRASMWQDREPRAADPGIVTERLAGIYIKNAYKEWENRYA